jgi:hypothetical protein
MPPSQELVGELLEDRASFDQARQKSLAEQLHDRHAVPACEGKESIELGRRFGVDGFVLFSYGDVTKPSERAPAGDYLQRIGKAAFSAP